MILNNNINMGKDIYIYWHVYLTPEGFEIAKNQLDLLISYGLCHSCKKITIGVVGKPNDFVALQSFIQSKLQPNYIKKVCFLHSEQNNVGESITIKQLYENALNLQDDDYILYFHTKGSSVNSVNYPLVHLHKFFWRKAMEFFVIKNWKKCISVMEIDPTISLCGSFFRHRGCSCYNKQEIALYVSRKPVYNIKHEIKRVRRCTRFTGNMWRARVKYVKTIHRKSYEYLLPFPLGIKRPHLRTFHEQFILQGSTPYYIFSFCDTLHITKPCRCRPNNNISAYIKNMFNDLFFDLL